jgi:hypothetical protein
LITWIDGSTETETGSEYSQEGRREQSELGQRIHASVR